MPIHKLTLILLPILIGGVLIFRNQFFHSKPPAISPTIKIKENQQVRIGETYYLFDVVDHKPEQIKTLLERARDLSNKAKSSNEKTRIAMVIHGPDVEIFDKKNYSQNKEIVDLAAQLDAFDVIDFKICQTAAESRGIDESSFPPFMEMVPFAAAEIGRLGDQGYVEL